MSQRVRSLGLVAVLAVGASAPVLAQESSPVPIECSTKPGTSQCVYGDADWCALILPADIDRSVIDHCAARVGEVFADHHTMTVPETLQASVKALQAELLASLGAQPQATPQASASVAVGSADEAIDWFHSEGIDEDETVLAWYWSAWNTSGDQFTTASIHIINDQPYILNVDKTDYRSSDMSLLQRTVDRFVPAASGWFADVLASTKPGHRVTETFDGIEVEYSAGLDSGSPRGSVHIQFVL